MHELEALTKNENFAIMVGSSAPLDRFIGNSKNEFQLGNYERHAISRFGITCNRVLMFPAKNTHTNMHHVSQANMKLKKWNSETGGELNWVEASPPHMRYANYDVFISMETFLM